MSGAAFVLLCAAICAGAGLPLVAGRSPAQRLRSLLSGEAAEPSAAGGAGASGGAAGAGGPSRTAGIGPRGGTRRSRTPGKVPSGSGADPSGATSGTGRSLDALAFDLDLVAICLLAGLPVDGALAHAAEASEDRSGLGTVARALRLGSEAPRGLRPELEGVLTLIRFSSRTGAALAPLLGAHASELRASEQRRRQIAAARLGVVLVLPLGVCVLPAFILLGVVPVLLTLVGDLLPALG